MYEIVGSINSHVIYLLLMVGYSNSFCTIYKIENVNELISG